jgi:hypothetical protein
MKKIRLYDVDMILILMIMIVNVVVVVFFICKWGIIFLSKNKSE